MKSYLVCLLALVGAATTGPVYEEPLLNYHENEGIAEAARIKQHESALDFDGRIAGGSNVNAGAAPFFGGLVITLTTGQQSVCGCSMLSNTRAVTAAHCWNDGNNRARQFTVVYGSNRLFSGGTRVNTNNVQMHGSWDHRTTANDVAIIVHSHVGFNNNINRINLASGSANYAGQTAQATGFGRTGDGSGDGSNQSKRQVNLPVITNDVCRRTFGNIVRDSNICTSGAGGRSTCRGDSGGPLTVGSGNNRILIGITSFGHRDGCTRGHPAVFARVTSFNSWIRARI